MLNIQEVREALSTEIIKLQRGESTPNVANAITKAVNAIIASVRLEIEFHKLFKIGVPKMDFLELPTSSAATSQGASETPS